MLMQTFGVNVVVLHDEKVLLTLRSDLPVWCLPGGAIEAGETLVQAAKREAREETGAKVDISGIVGVYSRPHWRNGGNHKVVFIGKQVGGELSPQDGEAVDISYFSLSELPESLIWWHRERIIDAVHANQIIARMQDVRWPLAGITYEESKQLVSQGELSIQELVKFSCQKPTDSDSHLELGEIEHVSNGQKLG
jgi:ADP-ribose pyrophosphatase YjhB (NUDIX family)